MLDRELSVRALLGRLMTAVALVAIAASPSLAEPPNKVGSVEPIRFASPSTASKRVLATLYLPPGYTTKGPRYPVLYALHGLYGEGRDWFDRRKGNLEPRLDRLIASGAIPPMIVVAPNGSNHYWTNHLGASKRRHADRVSLDLVAHVEREYHVRTDRSGRALVGISAGGHGALAIALSRPTDFAAVVSLGGALFLKPPTHRKVYHRVWGSPGQAGRDAHWQATSPVAMVEAASAETRWPKIFISAGRDDNRGKAKFVELARSFAAQLAARGVQHQLVEASGGHEWSAWMEPADQWLKFVGAAFETAEPVVTTPTAAPSSRSAVTAPAPFVPLQKQPVPAPR